jgi:hypothetical protein
MLMIRFTPRDFNSETCEGDMSSGPRKRKLGRIVEMTNSSRSFSVSEEVLPGVEVVGVGLAVVGVTGIGGDEFAFPRQLPLVKLKLKPELNALAGGV